MARGIAAVFDAIFLLIIAAVASSILLSAANSYGSSFEEHAKGVLMNYYAKQVVKVIVTASIERDGKPDYFLSYLREALLKLEWDVVEDKLRKIVDRAMKAVEDRYTYVVALETEKGNLYITKDGTCEQDPLAEYRGIRYSSATKILLRGDEAVPVTIRVTLIPLQEEIECS